MHTRKGSSEVMETRGRPLHCCRQYNISTVFGPHEPRSSWFSQKARVRRTLRLTKANCFYRAHWSQIYASRICTSSKQHPNIPLARSPAACHPTRARPRMRARSLMVQQMSAPSLMPDGTYSSFGIAQSHPVLLISSAFSTSTWIPNVRSRQNHLYSRHPPNPYPW
ncbi:hypothetical protein BD309DRAFT_466280 [Dichomitus squalens]|nr:hypothetical protein BD309DRAFT_466280 [Dichomitus squalens]